MVYGGVTAVAPLDLDVAAGAFLSILGPSGCGKSTLLKIIAGFADPSSGRVEIDGVDVTRIGPEKRPTNMVFQGYGLFPHMTVRQNIAFGLGIARVPAAEARRRIADVLELVQLAALADRAVDQLSGGQQQRVALARAIVMRPKVLLLDEPLAALDLKLRQAMQEELRRIHRQIGGTFVFVTHDQEEALNLSSEIVVMQAGRVEQRGTPQEIYRRPASLFVAGFVGESNRFSGRMRSGRIETAMGSFPADAKDGAEVVAILRPEAITLGPVRRADDVAVTAMIEDVVFLGERVKVVCRAEDGTAIHLRLSIEARGQLPQAGRSVTLSWRAADMIVIPESS
ncbi:MAG: ABC transporter ATP-binding protein [Rhodospirillaceae bacterium]|nr:ABC transporter ATP-binding protein [Rhodospirillaceae bacterium]